MSEIGTCCACGYDDDEQTPCPVMEDKQHCMHWWDVGEIKPAPADREADLIDKAYERSRSECECGYCEGVGEVWTGLCGQQRMISCPECGGAKKVQIPDTERQR